MRQMTVDLWHAASAMPDVPRWLGEARRTALESIGSEQWPRALQDLAHGDGAWSVPELAVGTIARFLPKAETARIVFVDGQHAPSLSRSAEAVTVRPLRDALDEAGVRARLEALARDDEPATRLSAATWSDGAYVHVEGEVEGIVHLVFIHTGRPLRSVLNLIHVDPNAHAKVLESFVHTADDEGTTLACTVIDAADGARVEHVKLQKEDSTARHVATQRSTQGRDSQIKSIVLDIGGMRAHQSIAATLDQPGAHCDLQGVFFGQREQVTDLVTRVDHVSPDCSSHQRYKGILDDASRGTFTGTVKVHAGARGTSSQQENRNLLLSNHARVDSTPQLEIDNDDVKCSHGSTIGQLEEDQLFFLRTRGIGKEQARMMLTRAFASDVIREAPEDMRQLMDKYLHIWFIKHQEHLR